MSNVLKNYASTLWMLAGIILGAIVGIWFTPAVPYLKPIGEIFMNLLFTIIVPLVFLSIVWAIYNLCAKQMVGKVLLNTLIVFLGMAVLLGTISYVACLIYNPLENFDTNWQLESTNRDIPVGELLVSNLTVNDFIKLFNKSSLLPLIIFAALFGYAIAALGEKGTSMARFIDQANQTIIKFIDIIFYYAPIGLGCYFAALVGTFGKEIAVGFGKTFIIYTVVSVLFYFIIYSLYAFIAGGKEGFKRFWRHILPATATSLSTCSSAASIPVNMDCAKKMGVSNDIAETMIPLGTSFHKDGSVIGSVFKIMFLVYLFGAQPSVWTVIGVALLATLLVTAVPVGGGTISETLILTMMGFPLTALPILTIIATIIDPPATMLNVCGDTSSSMLVTRVVEGKNWLKKKQ